MSYARIYTVTDRNQPERVARLVITRAPYAHLTTMQGTVHIIPRSRAARTLLQMRWLGSSYAINRTTF
jgi:hypothetical protein